MLGLMECFFKIVKLFKELISLKVSVNKAKKSSAYLKETKYRFLKKKGKNKPFFIYNSKKKLELMRVKKFLHNQYAASNYLSTKFNLLEGDETYTRLMAIPSSIILPRTFIFRRSHILPKCFIPFGKDYFNCIKIKKFKFFLSKKFIKNSKKKYFFVYLLRCRKNAKLKEFLKLVKGFKKKKINPFETFKTVSENKPTLRTVKNFLNKVLVMSPENLRNFTTLLDMFY